MPTPTPSIFLSHSSTDKPWVESLHRNLIAALAHRHGQPAEVFLDKVHIVPATSWPQRLDKGLAESDRFLLVVTPEAMASAWVNKELLATLADRPNWPTPHILVALLRWAPLPEFLKDCQYVDFREHDEESYREALARLVAGIDQDEDLDPLPELPDDLDIPPYPADPLGEDLRRQAVHWLAPLLEKRWFRNTAQAELGADAALLDALPPERLASHIVVDLTRGDTPPTTALHDALEPLHAIVAEVRPDAADDLQALLDELQAAVPAPAERSSWARYLDLVRQDTREASTFVIRRMGDPRLLGQLYVQRTVDARHPEPPSGDRKIDPERLPAPGRQTLEDLLAATLPPDSDSDPVPHRYVLLGEPGAGKSTLLRHLAGACAERDDLPWIPILASIADAVEGEVWLPDWIAARYRTPSAPENLGSRLDAAARREDSPILVLLDGLDEVASERREDARRWLRTLVHEWPHARFVVTSRHVPYEPLGDGFEELEMARLTHQDRVRLIGLHLTDRDEPSDAELEEAERHVTELERNPSVAEWLGNPLYVTLLALLLRQGKTPSPLRHELYRQVIDVMLQGEHRPDAVAMKPLETVRRILADFAHRMTETGHTEVGADELSDRLLTLTPLVDQLKAYRERYRRDLDTFFDDLTHSGLFAPYARPHWRFLHRTFREALTARHLAEQAKEPEGTQALLQRAGSLSEDDTPDEDLGRWAEPFSLLVGQVDDPDSLVIALVEANEQLGLRSLSGAHGLEVDTVRTVLELTTSWEQRAEMFRAVPRVVGNPSAALELLDDLRAHTRDGNDLFWLHWAVRQLGRRHRELGDEAADLLGRFFEYIPAPPVELFTEVETPLDGVVPLWREIPAGEFWMGSPETETDRYGDEGPQHRVEMLSGFRMAAVPVTRAQYAAFDPDHTSGAFDEVDEEELAHHPVNEVTWFAAVSFCRWLAAAVPDATGARLPTEAEWEHACRAGTATPYWSGEGEKDLDRVGWYDGNSDGRTHRVGEKPANPWGLYDVHGNVWEWTLSRPDDYSGPQEGVFEDPNSVSLEDEIGDDPGGGWRVFRGGSFADVARIARSAFRFGSFPGIEWRSQGFRVLLPAAPGD